MIWTRFRRTEVDLFATSEKAHCPQFFSLSHSPLEGDALRSHWPAANLYAFPPQILPLVLCKIKEGASFSDIHHPEPAEPALVPRPDRTAGGTTLANPHQDGFAIPDRWLVVAPKPGNCGAFMCSCFRVIRGAERSAFSCARCTLGGTSTLYETFVCLKIWGVFVKCSYRSYRPGYLLFVGCSAFSAMQAG